jgi:hypothetical protein
MGSFIGGILSWFVENIFLTRLFGKKPAPAGSGDTTADVQSQRRMAQDVANTPDRSQAISDLEKGDA